MVTGHFTYETLHPLDSLTTEFHVVYALMQLYNVQQELRDHYRYSSHMNSRMSILTVTIVKECRRRSVHDVSELSSKQSDHNPTIRINGPTIHINGPTIRINGPTIHINGK